jgi:hypothetical protein
MRESQHRRNRKCAPTYLLLHEREQVAPQLLNGKGNSTRVGRTASIEPAHSNRADSASKNDCLSTPFSSPSLSLSL